MRKILTNMVLAAALAVPMTAQAGPIIIGGDDLNDHGSWNGTANLAGWLYIQNALANLLSQVTLPANDGTIVVLGSAPSVPASSTPTSSDGCGAVYWPATALSRTVTCIDGAAAITTYLTGVASGSNRPAVIVYPGNDVGNAIDSSEETAISASASAIATYVANGGGILGHTGPYAWLTTLLPGITILRACTVTGAALTPTGQAAFPTITNANITSGPCHNTFGGNIGSLQVLARDGNNAQFILGGGATTVIAPTPPEPPITIPTLGFNALAALIALIVAAAFAGRGRIMRLRN